MIEFPFFSMQQLNLDWVIEKIKGMLSFLPDDGTAGQILRRTADGAEWSDEETGGGGAVDSVNGQTGAVVLGADDILMNDNTSVEDSVSDLKSAYINKNSFEEVNIFTLLNATEGYFVRGSDGALAPDARFGVTDYLDISAYISPITMSFLKDPSGAINLYQGAFFDEDKTYISGYYKSVISSDTDYVINIPSNAKYLRFSFLLNVKDNYYIKGTSKNSISYDLCSKFNLDVFSTENATDGYFARSSDGTLAPAANVSVTDFIPIPFTKQIIIGRATALTHQGALYDINKNFVTGYWISGDNPQAYSIVDVPDNAYYVRISYTTASANLYYAKTTVCNQIEFAKKIPYISKQNAKFSKMKMNCLGDSITYGYIPDSGAQMANPYPSLIKSILGLSECRNYGISGSTLAVNSGNYQPMCIRYADMSDDADIVLVFGGTNDYGREVYTPNLGTITDTVNTTIYGALNLLCEGLITKYPKALIFLCTPLKRADKTGVNGGGYTLEDVADAIREVGQKFGMPVLDLNYKGGFYISNDTFRAQYGGNDKLHPNQAFNTEHLAPMIARFIDSTI